MNPPDYYHVPEEVLDAAKRAIIKYLASGNPHPKLKEPLTNMLVGGEWPDNSISRYLPIEGTFRSALLYFLPCDEEISRKEDHPNHSSHMWSALNKLEDYLNEPS